MPPPCMRCDSQRVINLETARKLGIAAGAVAGTLKGAYASFYSPGRLIATTSFPLGRVAAAVMAGTSGGIAGAAAGHRLVQTLLPPGDGIPWLCTGCGHSFRDLG